MLTRAPRPKTLGPGLLLEALGYSVIPTRHCGVTRGVITSALPVPPVYSRQLALTPGTRLGVYEITAQIGEGGMGQVYRATDTTLSRQVAIKILPDAFAADPDAWRGSSAKRRRSRR